MMVTESAWVMPDAHASEGPFLVAAYQSLSGVDAYFWFATGTDEWTPPQSANGYMPSQGKWLFADPDMLGGFPAAALMYRTGCIRRGEPVVHEERSLEDIFQRRDPIIAEGAGFDPNRNSGNIAPESSVKGGVNPLAFLVGRVEVVYGGQPQASKVADLKPFIDVSAKEVRSITGELTFNYDKGFCLLNAPKAQGVAAFFKNRKDFKTANVEIASDNDYGTVLVVSMDGKPIRESGKLLVQATTQCRPTGWQEKPVTIKVKEGTFPGFEVVNIGKAPWQVTRAKVTLTIRNPGLAKATVLDANGNAAGEAEAGETRRRGRAPVSGKRLVRHPSMKDCGLLKNAPCHSREGGNPGSASSRNGMDSRSRIASGTGFAGMTRRRYANGLFQQPHCLEDSVGMFGNAVK